MVSVDIGSAESLKTSITISQNSNNTLITDHHINRKFTMIKANKLTSKETHIKLISKPNCKPTSQIYLDNLLQNNLSGCWGQIYFTHKANF